jgi:hypothetical protein
VCIVGDTEQYKQEPQTVRGFSPALSCTLRRPVLGARTTRINLCGGESFESLRDFAVVATVAPRPSLFVLAHVAEEL